MSIGNNSGCIDFLSKANIGVGLLEKHNLNVI